MLDQEIIRQLVANALDYVAVLANITSKLTSGQGQSSSELRAAFEPLKETALRARRAGLDWIPTTDRELKFWALAVARKILV